MSAYFCITVRFLQPCSHGRGDGGEPEWPPSPLRMFQALVAAAAGRWNERIRLSYAVPALEWLARQPAPTVVAAAGVPSGVKYRLYVPDNVGDKVAKSWRGGNTTASIADYRTEKDVRPTHLVGDAVHYLYPVADSDTEFAAHKEALCLAALSITHLGWGVDMVTGNAAVISGDEGAKLTGERWQPAAGRAGTQLRVPRGDTLKALMDKHAAFLNRLSDDGFKPVPPLTAFHVVGYRRATDPESRMRAAFAILRPDASRNASFDTARRCRDVAAWVRHATAHVCEGWPFGDTAGFVCGHDAHGKQLRGDGADDRFMYLPLPTINAKLNRVESIRRVLIVAPPRFADRIDWLRRRLPGQDLIDTDRGPVGMLNLLPTSDWVLRQYTDAAQVWSTVTPVVMPGRYTKGPGRTLRLLRAAFSQAGWPEELFARAEIEWRDVGFRPGVDLARRYRVPEQLNHLARLHVRVRWPTPVRGPLAIGAGRYRGLGVFATERG